MKLPSEYYDCVAKMLAAIRAWGRTNSFYELSFRLPPQGVMLAAPLDVVADKLAANETTKGLIAFVDEATNHEGTAFQLCVLVRHLQLRHEDWSWEEVHRLTGWRMPQA